jgi:hypothetical protein
VIIKGLAESKTFQRFALRTHVNIEKATKTGTEYMNKGIDEVTKLATEAAKESASSAGPPKPPLRGVPGFFRAMGREIQSDFGAPVK